MASFMDPEGSRNGKMFGTSVVVGTGVYIFGKKQGTLGRIQFERRRIPNGRHLCRRGRHKDTGCCASRTDGYWQVPWLTGNHTDAGWFVMPAVEKVSSIMSTGSYNDGLATKRFDFVRYWILSEFGSRVPRVVSIGALVTVRIRDDLGVPVLMLV